jgi:hypothetical protein
LPKAPQRTRSGLPVGLQIVGPRFSDSSCLKSVRCTKIYLGYRLFTRTPLMPLGTSLDHHFFDLTFACGRTLDPDASESEKRILRDVFEEGDAW